MATQKDAYHRIRGVCHQAIIDGLDWVWVDSCCIDKRSSAELSEAINSMYQWYWDAQNCYVYLSDVPANVNVNNINGEFFLSRWFTRGWTLQELLAPNTVDFYSQDWVQIGTKAGLLQQLSSITKIKQLCLATRELVRSMSVATRMSWAAHRETSRPEDMSYCLMGIFRVNMPLLYGEGDTKAFLRLQEEIMKQSDDQSLFAWYDDAIPSDNPSALFFSGLLAVSPRKFALSGSINSYSDWEDRPPYQLTNRGLQISLPMTPVETAPNGGVFLATLHCSPDLESSEFVGIYLMSMSGYQTYARVYADRCVRVRDRGYVEEIYVKQQHPLYIAQAVPNPQTSKLHQPSMPRLLPYHVIQVQDGEMLSGYTIDQVVMSSRDQRHPPRKFPPTFIPGIHTYEADHIPRTVAFTVPKSAERFAGAVILSKGTDILLLSLGSRGEREFGFSLEKLSGDKLRHLRFEVLEREFRPLLWEAGEVKECGIRMRQSGRVQDDTQYCLVEFEEI
ncbi:Vegetative incompatibility protein HET-E-1 [Cladobotryum mycophilum]|uniref:Vegetative incompatibility protein HET-E-1 n=1 Tax=Cladobotryum mycophilum TaxID=491253 RepID=A0ABR0SGJ6_9HYPO